MNFTQEIKRELIKRVPPSPCCGRAFLDGILSTSGVKNAPVGFTCEDESVASHILSVFSSIFSASMDVTEAVYDPKKGRDKLTFAYAGENAVQIKKDIRAGGLESILSDFRPCCAQAYLAGAFLGSGSCTLPREGVGTGYHLEIVFAALEQAQNFCELLDMLQLIGGIVARENRSVVYLKSREAISDFLSTLGVSGALRTLEKTAAAREERGRVNRVENCIAGNADKAAIASAAQIVALTSLKNEGVLARLSEPLCATAYSRLENPELSLTELANLLGVTKSCFNHRMRKLMELYEGKRI